ncbi:unnamed protein product [Leptosia nina]|uniref:Uncharacterized protein n=1 Tax=Leptosia nina TaxID=320188 RepID=A0AAV1IYG3_9NEOP
MSVILCTNLPLHTPHRTHHQRTLRAPALSPSPGYHHYFVNQEAIEDRVPRILPGIDEEKRERLKVEEPRQYLGHARFGNDLTSTPVN